MDSSREGAPCPFPLRATPVSLTTLSSLSLPTASPRSRVFLFFHLLPPPRLFTVSLTRWGFPHITTTILWSLSFITAAPSTLSSYDISKLFSAFSRARRIRFEIPRYRPNARKLACHIKTSPPAPSLAFLHVGHSLQRRPSHVSLHSINVIGQLEGNRPRRLLAARTAAGMAEEDGPKPERASATAEQPTPSASFALVNASPSTASKPSRKASTSPPANVSRTAEESVKQTPLESQPMTATTSTSSQVAENSTKEATDANGASPYGTRSRNRTGSSRPNYAEEPEIMEYEWSSKKLQATAEAANATPQPSVNLEKTSGANTRRSSNVTPVAQSAPTRTVAAINTGHQIPGMSSFSLHPEPAAGPPAPTRKRKAPGTTPATQQNSSNPPHNTSTSGQSRKSNYSGHYPPTRTTTLMTFERCQGYLRNGKLQADDGTWLAIGGKLYFTSL